MVLISKYRLVFLDFLIYVSFQLYLVFRRAGVSEYVNYAFRMAVAYPIGYGYKWRSVATD